MCSENILIIQYDTNTRICFKRGRCRCSMVYWYKRRAVIWNMRNNIAPFVIAYNTIHIDTSATHAPM